ncbi:SSL2 DNA or RNA helicases of superfamily II [uncultured Caudovirales phage]|uniref:SSL2 DNA or RNA helicases of superfamily II n=1 Tax=uncultured Caudovirales phage TaxID=2100421 RepID=A0A6J5P0K0_9CAUD|nr:SSL2 DNA or RNA helicases of superfamily II [uncultured Caudovirales phage]
MDILEIEKIDEVYIRVICEPSIAFELNDYFTFDVPGAKFMPAYRNKYWDGKIRLFNTMTCTIYAGLLRYIEEFAKSRNYKVEYLSDFSSEEFSLNEANEFIKNLKLPEKYKPRDYQIDAFVHAIRESRALLLSPTASGKSFIIYMLMRYYACRTLIIVPTTSLVSQLASDFADYGFDSDKFVHRIYSGKDKNSNLPVVVSTWQSIYKMDKEYFKQFDLVIGDEAHLFKAKSLTTILSKLTDCKYKFGFTGTLDGTQTHKLVLEGLFGPVRKVISTSELMDKKMVAKLLIKCIVLNYPDKVKKENKGLTYPQEMDYISTLSDRNRFIKNLALSLDSNTLILFQYVEKHGKALYDIISKGTDRKVYFVHGGVDADDRENIRKIVETEKDAIIIASYGTFSTGVNIKNLHNVIFSSPSKSVIRVLQSIGRGLRLADNKESVTLFDISDDMSWKSSRNHTLNHFMERVKIYNQEKFEYKIYKVSLNIIS